MPRDDFIVLVLAELFREGGAQLLWEAMGVSEEETDKIHGYPPAAIEHWVSWMQGRSSSRPKWLRSPSRVHGAGA